MCNKPHQKTSLDNTKEPSTVNKQNVFEDADCWRCRDCGHEWSFIVGDDEVPEICTYCTDNEDGDGPVDQLQSSQGKSTVEQSCDMVTQSLTLQIICKRDHHKASFWADCALEFVSGRLVYTNGAYDPKDIPEDVESAPKISVVNPANLSEKTVVYVPQASFDEVGATDINEFEEHLTNLIYSSPLFCVVTVGEEEFTLHADCEYKYNKDLYLHRFKKIYDGTNQNVIDLWVEASLPNEI